MSVPDLIVTCSTLHHINTWVLSVTKLQEYFKGAEVITVVPDSEIAFFREKNFQFNRPTTLLCDSEILGHSRYSLVRILAGERAGWYLQQLLKIETLNKYLQDDHLGLIWDSDTILLRKLDFKTEANVIRYAGEREFHKPYFDFIERVLGLKKQVCESFVSQFLFVRRKWLDKFIEAISISEFDYYLDVLIGNIDFTELSSFSEYETLGTYFKANFPQEFQHEPRWLVERRGYSKVGSVSEINSLVGKFILRKYIAVAFEEYDLKQKPSEFIARELLRSVKRLYVRFINWLL